MCAWNVLHDLLDLIHTPFASIRKLQKQFSPDIVQLDFLLQSASGQSSRWFSYSTSAT